MRPAARENMAQDPFYSLLAILAPLRGSQKVQTLALKLAAPPNSVRVNMFILWRFNKLLMRRTNAAARLELAIRA